MVRSKVVVGLLGIAVVASAQNYTMGVVGVTRVSKPAMALNLIGNSFGDADTTLNELAPISQFNGAVFLSQADQIFLWNTATQMYSTFAVYDDSAYGGTNKEWRSAGDFYGGEANPLIPAGSAFWLKSSGSSTGSNVFLSGNVVGSEYVTNQIAAGLQLLAYPFTSDFNLNTSSLRDSATGAVFLSQADQIFAWNAASQVYATYALYDDSSYGGTIKEWRSAGNFYNPAEAIILNLGQGFWYQAKSSFSWVETNLYYNNL